jgi:hypothetical protein
MANEARRWTLVSGLFYCEVWAFLWQCKLVECPEARVEQGFAAKR